MLLKKIPPFFLTFLLMACPALAAREYQPVGSAAMPPVQKAPAKKTASPSKTASGKGVSPQQKTAIKASAASDEEIQKAIKTANPGALKLFGTVEFRRPLDSLPGWLDVLKRNEASPIFQLQKHFNKSTTWANLKEKVAGKTPREQMQIINSFWNGWPYIEDKANWGKEDYWAIPAQFLKKSGDCEDYAIAKYFTLKELGFDPKQMRLVVLRDTIRNLAHAVLAVYLDGDAYILDNLSNVLFSHKRLGNYSPQYSVNEYGRWAHIKGKKAR